MSLSGRALPAGYRDEMRALLAESPVERVRHAGSLLVFQLGGLRLALPARVASAIAPVLHIARIPHRSGTVLLGLVAFRGEILPCCSLARILDLGAESAEPTAAARTLILEERSGRRWAVPIDGVLGVRRAAGEHCSLTVPLAAQWLAGSFADEAGEFHLLDDEVLFRQITLATA
jgi:chemotaxis signal transduction protein